MAETVLMNCFWQIQRSYFYCDTALLMKEKGSSWDEGDKGQARVLVWLVLMIIPFNMVLFLNTSILGLLPANPAALHLAFLK